MTRKTFLALLAVLAVQPVMAQEPLTLFGIPFNQSLAIPECPWKDVRDYMSRDRKATKREYNNIHFSDTLCYTQHRNIGQPPTDGNVSFVFPLSKAPSMGRLNGRLVNGRLQRMAVYTHGISAQASDFEMLTQKFGQPTKLNRPAVQNRMGASFDTIEAEWALSDGISVLYGSALTKIDEGIVIVSTPEGDAAEQQAQEEFKRKFGGTEI
jgi:hypothetical protein